MRIDPIDPAEKIVVTFDFTDGLDTGETLTGTITANVSMALGSDATPASLLNGTPTFDATSKMVLVPVQGRTVDCDYDIKIVSGTSNAQKTLALIGRLPIREDR